VTFPVIAVIASAGGLDAIVRVLTPLPRLLPAAILVALHQDPTHVSRLTSILGAVTRLEVAVATNSGELRPGSVLVVPPAQHLIVTGPSAVGLIPTGDLPPPRPSGDLLLATLAVTCGPRALAVILSGNGHDAQAGVRAVVHCGGTVLAQDERSSKFFAMPSAAIATDMVSQVLDIDDIAEAIVRHTQRRIGKT